MRRTLLGFTVLGSLALASTVFCGRAEAVFFSNVRLETVTLETAVNVYSNPVITTTVGKAIRFDIDLYQTAASTTMQFVYTKSSGTLTSIGTGTSTVVYPTGGLDQTVLRNEFPAPAVAGTWNGTAQLNITSAAGFDYRFDPLNATNVPTGNLSNSRTFPFQLRVLDEATPSFSPSSTVTSQVVNLGTVITGAPDQTSNFSVNNRAGAGGAALTVGLDLTNSSTSGDTPALFTDLSTPAGPINAGSGFNYVATLNSGSLGTFSEVLTIESRNDVTNPTGADDRPDLTLTLQGTVIGHSEGSLASPSDVDSQNINFGTVIVGAPTQTSGFVVANVAPGGSAALDLDSIVPAGSGELTTDATTFSNLPAGNVNNYTASMNTSAAGAFSGTHTFNVSDEDLPGATNGNPLSLNLSGTVLDHSEGSFDGGTNDDSTAINLGTVITGAPTPSQSFSVYNVPSTNGAALTAGLDLDSVNTSGSSAITTSAGTFTNLAAGSGQTFNASMSTASAGNFSTTQTYGVSDQNLLGATSGADLTATFTGTVLDHSEASLASPSNVDSDSLVLGPVIIGGSTSQSFDIHNLASVNGAALTVGLDLDNVTQSGSSDFSTDAVPFSGLVAGTSQTFNASVTATSVGAINGSTTFDVSDADLPGATAGTSLTLNLSATALDHSQASFATPTDTDSDSINLGTVIKGAAAPTQNFSIHNLASSFGAALTAGLDLDTVGNSGSAALSTDAAPFSNLAAATSQNFTATMSTATAGNFAKTQTYGVSDQDLPGATAGTSLTLNLTGTVLDPSEASFTSPTNNDNSSLNLGTVITGGSTSQNYSIFNLASPNGAALTAKLDLDSVTSSGSTDFTTNAAPFSNLMAGTSQMFTAMLTGTTAGAISGSQTYAVSDENLPGASSGSSLTLNMSATVLDHSEASFSTPTDADVTAVNLGTVIKGAPAPSQSYSIHNLPSGAGAAFTAGLDVDSVSSSGSPLLTTNATISSNLAAGNSLTYNAVMNTTQVGNFSATKTFAVSDQNLPGATSGNSLNLNISGTVIDPSNGSLTSPTDNDTRIVNIARVIVGAPTQSTNFSIYNLASVNGPSLTASLDLDTVSSSGAPEITTNAAPFSNLAAGGSQTFTAQMTAGTVGNFSTVQTFGVSDEDLPGAGSDTLQLTLTGQVLSHAIPSIGTTPASSYTINLGNRFEGTGIYSVGLSLFALVNVPLLTAALDLDSIVPDSGNSAEVFISGLNPFTNLPAPSTVNFLGSLDTSVVGTYSSSWVLNFSDEDIPGATSTSITLTITGNVLPAAIVPEPGSMVVWTLLGLCVAGAGYRRRRAKRAGA